MQDDSLVSDEDIQKLVSMGFERVNIMTMRPTLCFVLFICSVLNSFLSFSIIIYFALTWVVVN